MAEATKSKVGLYWDEFARWLVARQLAPGGDLSKDDNEKWIKKLDDMWCVFSIPEKAESAAHFKSLYPPNGTGYIDCPADSPLRKVKMRPLKAQYEQSRQRKKG